MVGKGSKKKIRLVVLLQISNCFKFVKQLHTKPCENGILLHIVIVMLHLRKKAVWQSIVHAIASSDFF